MKKKNAGNELALAALATTILVLTGCAPDASEEIGETESDAQVVESAAGAAGAALNDSEQNASFARSTTPLRQLGNWLLAPAYADSCGLSRFTPSIGSSSCAGYQDGKTVLSTFDGCSGWRGDEFTFTGTITLSFDAATTCDEWINGGSLPTSGSVTRTTDGLVRTNPNGSKVTSDSNSHTNYGSETVAGGVKTSFQADGIRTVDILGVHRVRVSPKGRTVFDHSVRTASPLTVTGTLAAKNRRVTSGAVKVDHNLAKFTSVATMTGLEWDSTCCHPIGGLINVERNGSRTGTITVDFNTGTCGQVQVTRSGGESETVQLSACE